MSLFLVNRYLGEEESESVSKESRSQALLAKLQQKAKEKQKQSRTERPPKERTEQQDVKKKRKADKNSGQEPQLHKKRKSEDADSDNPDEPVEEAKKNEKQKKKKKKVQSGISVKDLPETPVTGRDGQEDSGGGEEETETENVTLKETTEKTSAPTGFTVLGGFENKPVQKVHRVLPQWLAQPDVIHRDIKSNLVPISDLPGLSALLVKKLQNNGIQQLFPVQAEVIPAILESAQQGLLIGRGGYKPRDICVSAPTGSGKTLSFVIPVVQVLTERVVCEVRALAVLPTKELAQQVCKVFTSYAEGSSLKVVMVAGQKSFAAEQASLSELRGGMRRSLADIVVATPGRLVDHINKNSGFSLEHLRFLIIDEADRMIDSMHQSWLSQVVKAVYRSGGGAEVGSIFRRTEPAYVTAASLSPPQMPLQKLLFSATLTQNPEKLQQLGLHQPRLFSSIHSHSSSTTPAALTQTQGGFDFPQGLTEYYVPCTLSKKPLLILHFILRMKLSPVLCFTNSRETAHRLYLLVHLFGGVQAAEFSSRLSPAERKKTLKEFEQGKIQLLISTDAAARGIDINGVKCVVNYDAPQYIRTYIHRIGRTARAGKPGLAFTFLLGVQEKNFLQMVVEAGTPGIQKQIVKPENLKGMEARYEQTLQELANAIKVPSQTHSLNVETD
ncbi:ATP-dependent RNA helicase DDX51 isoform X1 [Anarrhichthys ocellatus]|uniref:ATP-dependent RNA helicase DDX51 isoform X1 n=1 Tax=Anarrhichthys ocellatus TaxID=433405 RepID=UPI0012EE3F69|nr:ATP-dependent RNA helicase DDX51 isoform X1 [Anarrhichthys ocellatus]